jgi:hypothetical protein
VLHALLVLDLRQYTAETAVEKLLSDSFAFKAVWDGQNAGDAVAALNTRFAAYWGPLDWTSPHLSSAPPFATTYGPSVYVCTCGHRFGNPEEELTEEVVMALATARREHFREAFRTHDGSWYPAEGTLHYSLHRAVQTVIKEQFPEAMELDSAMVPAVAAYLKRDAKGFLCHPLMEKHVPAVLESYLELRRAGQPHPEGVLTLRVKAEREAILVPVG